MFVIIENWNFSYEFVCYKTLLIYNYGDVGVWKNVLLLVFLIIEYLGPISVRVCSWMQNFVCCLVLNQPFFFQEYASKKAWTIYSFIGYFWGSFYILVELLYKLLKCFEFTDSCRDSSILNEFLFLFFFVKGKHHKIIKYYNLLGTGFNQRRYCASITQNYDCFFSSIVFPTNACLIVIINIPNWSKIKNNHDIYIIKALVVVVSIPYIF